MIAQKKRLAFYKDRDFGTEWVDWVYIGLSSICVGTETLIAFLCKYRLIKYKRGLYDLGINYNVANGEA
jgi:hypothetical protein